MDSHVVELVKDFRFEAAHYLPNVPEGHKCRRMHGHSFRGEVAVRGPIDPRIGWLVDFADLKRILDPVVARLDHYLLNEIEGLDNPTSEVLAVWIWNQVAPSLPQLVRVTIEETCTTRCSYFGAQRRAGTISIFVTRSSPPGIAVRTRTGDDRELQTLEANIFRGGGEVATPDQIRF